MEKKIVLLSNAYMYKYENTLVKFKNDIINNYLPAHKSKWFLALESLGFNATFTQSSDIPKIIKVISPNVKSVLKNGSYCKEIGIISLLKSDIGKYYFKQFLSLENFELQDQIPDCIEINLVDQFDKPLNLDFGAATFVKLHLTSSKMNKFHLRITSEKNNIFSENSANKFDVELVKKIKFLNENPKMALTSIILWDSIYYSSDLDLRFKVKEGVNTHKFIVNKSITNFNELLEDVKQKMKEWIDIEIKNEKYIIKGKKNTSLHFSRDLAFMFGWSNIQHGKAMKITMLKNKKFTPKYKKQSISLFPSHLFLYCNITKPSMVGDGLHQLLKVIPIPNQRNEDYRAIEFEHEEYLPITISELKYLHFELRSHSGSLIEFSNKNALTFINITFK